MSTSFLNSQSRVWNVFVFGIKSKLQIATLWSFFFLAPWILAPLLLGGLMQLPVKFPVLYKHFTGCIRNVYIDHKFLDLSQPLYNNGTSAKCKAMGNTCAYKPCERGTCFNILSSRGCPTGFDGSRCETGIEFLFTDMLVNIPLALTLVWSVRKSTESFGIFSNAWYLRCRQQFMSCAW